MKLYFYAIAVLFWANLVTEILAQDRSCLGELAPCLNYLNGTEDVPDSCCDPLKSVIRYKPECLCSLISKQGSNQAEQAGINVAEAQQLPARCGQHVNPLGCLTGSPESRNSDQSSASKMGLAALSTILWVLNAILLAPWN